MFEICSRLYKILKSSWKIYNKSLICEGNRIGIDIQ